MCKSFQATFIWIKIEGMTIGEKFKKYLGYLAIVFVVFLNISLLRNILKTRESLKTIENKEKDVQALEIKKKELEEALKKVESESFIEGQIRNQLGLSKEGEMIIVLPEDEVLRNLVPDIPKEEKELPDPPYRKWLELFF